MKKFADKFVETTLQPQIFTMLLIVLILSVLSVVIYQKTKKQKENKAPSGMLLFAEQYVMGVDSLYNEATEGKLPKPAPYIFTLLTFLALGNIMGVFGFEPPATSYSVTLTLGLISWIGIYVVGITFQKWRFFKKYINPVEMIGQFSPLISLSFRMFGNIIGGSTIMFLIYHVTGALWENIPVIGEVNLLGPLLFPLTQFFHAYFDLFDGLIQAFVFTLLTMIYWTLEAETEEVEVKAKKVQKTKKTTTAKAAV